MPDSHRQTYLGMVTAMDDAVGNIIATLRDAGMYEDSVILFFSDNGGPAGDWPPVEVMMIMIIMMMMMIMPTMMCRCTTASLAVPATGR